MMLHLCLPQVFVVGTYVEGQKGNADFGSHALLHEHTKLALIFNLDQLLRPIGRVGNVELHLDGWVGAVKTNGAWLSTSRRRSLRMVVEITHTLITLALWEILGGVSEISRSVWAG